MLKWFYKLIPLTVQLRLAVVMTFFDLFMTLIWIYSGNATEANPLLRFALGRGILWFIISKLTLGLGALWIFSKHKTHWLVRSVIPFIFCSYGL